MDEQRRGAVTQPAAAHWQRVLWAMVGIQFVMSMSFSVLTPIMPLMLPSLGVTSPAAIDLWAGVINASSPFIAAIASPLWGQVADRRGRKLMLMRTSLAVCICTALMGAAFNVWQFFAFRALMGAFAGFSASAIALVASQVPEQRLGFALGWLGTGQLVGSLLGPVLGGGLADLAGSYRVPFYLTSVVSLIGLVLVQLTVDEQFTPPASTRQRRSVFGNLKLLTAWSSLLPLLLVLLLAQFAVRTVQPLVTLFVQELVGNVPALATLAGLAFSITGVADLLASPFLGKRSDTIGYRRVLLICLLGATLTSAPQAFVHSYWVFVIQRFGMGLFIGGILPTANALVGRIVDRAHRGTVYGMTASAAFLGNSLGPLTGGAIAATIGLRWVFLVPAALLFANFVWVYRTVPEFTDQ